MTTVNDIEKIMSDEFSELVESLANTEDMTYLEALSTIVVDNHIDYPQVIKLLSPRLKELIQIESVNLHLLAGETSDRLF